MRSCYGFNNLFNRDRKAPYIILSIVLISVLTLTVVYASLFTTLNINGTAEVISSSWNIYLDNVQLNSRSATTTAPTITNSTTAAFSTTLSKSGDFYEFTIDVVNNGSIDAMIDNVTKTPTLTATQAKYLNYIVEYQNGESINTKQLVAKNSFVRLKVKVEFRKDITESDLPSQPETINLSFKVNYIQSDDSSENITINNSGKLIKIVSGTGKQVGDEICIGQECFYVISSDEDSVTALAKYNLYVGNECLSNDSASCKLYGMEATGLQDSTMFGWISNELSRTGTTVFSSSGYWGDISEPTYVYNNNSVIYEYIEKYKRYIENQGVQIEEARLIKKEEVKALGCSDNDCKTAPIWVYSSTYWTGTAGTNKIMVTVGTDGGFGNYGYYYDTISFGVRPVIKISLSQL